MARRTREQQIELAQLAAAYHEAGHAIAHKVGGGKVRSLRIWAGGNGLTDTVEKITDHNRAHYLVMALAGGEAEAHFLSRNGYSLGSARRATRPGSRSDLAEFHRQARGTGITEAQARKEARKLIRRHWGRINRTAKNLARRGRLSGAWL